MEIIGYGILLAVGFWLAPFVLMGALVVLGLIGSAFSAIFGQK